MAILASEVIEYARRRAVDPVGTEADAKLYEVVNDAVDLIALSHPFGHYKRRGYLNLLAPYSTGTIAFTQGSANVTLTGGTWPTNAASANAKLYVPSVGKVFSVSSRTSNSVIVIETAWSPANASALAYTLLYDEYDLPDDFLRFHTVMPGEKWGWGPCPLSDIDELWQRQSYLVQDQEYADAFAIGGRATGKSYIQFWPHPDSAVNVLYSYYRRPSLVSASGDTVDYPPAQRLLLHAAIDYLVAVAFPEKNTVGKPTDAYARFKLVLGEVANSKDQAPRDLPGLLAVPRSRGRIEPRRI